MNRRVPPTSRIQTLIVSPTLEAVVQHAPQHTLRGRQEKKYPGSQPRSSRTVSTTCCAGRPPTVTRVGPLTSLVPGALATAATRSADDPPMAELSSLAHGVAGPRSRKPVQKIAASAACPPTVL